MLLVKLPQLHPVIAANVGMTVEVEEHGLRRAAPQLVAQGLPIEFRIGLKIRFLLREHLFAVASLPPISFASDISRLLTSVREIGPCRKTRTFSGKLPQHSGHGRLAAAAASRRSDRG